MGLIRKSVEFQRINMDWLTIGEKSKHFQSTFLEKRYILFNSFKLLQFLSLSLSSSSSSSPSSSFSSSSSRPLLRVKIFSIFSANFRQKKCQAKLYNIGELHKRINYWCKIIKFSGQNPFRLKLLMFVPLLYIIRHRLYSLCHALFPL